ncbi:Down syndrome cell adhesion molecule-like protein 1 isoform X2 [Nematostella vectensis]|uniref:Down syndrome cell adhesion molecule-like protein 1 isoform X2 n=1 Tax=Nematostella vectensis TaxID=45351 RepID=UPI0020779AEC|nr:Down syndrome cell adhesion molecule-like protein 1 isoform X2 [Nematostella vectensis]
MKATGLVAFFTSVLLWHINFTESKPWILRFADEPADTTFAHTQWAVLTCHVAANPPASVTWRLARTDTAVTNVTGLRYVMANGSLVFPPFSAERLDPSIHRVDYQCLAKNRFGALISRAAKLRAVVVRPFRVYAMDSKVTLGNSAVIKTVVPDYAQSYTAVKAWYYDRHVVPLGGRYTIMPSGDLVITNAHAEDENSMYHWTAVNTLTGETHASNPAKLVVVPSSSPFAPRMTSLVHNLTLIAGETAVLQCTAAGSPTPYFRWLKSGKSLTMGGRMSVIAGGSLMIESTMASDEANYTCQAVNNVGSVHMAIYLEVIVPITFKERPKPQAAQVGFPRKNMECDVTGEPEPKITWYQNAQSLGQPKGRISIRDNDLVIATVYGQDNGVYQCVADNGRELVQSSAEFYAGFSVPTFNPGTPDIILYPGTPLQITCEVSAIPYPRDVQWYHDDIPLTGGHDYIITAMPGTKRSSRLSKLSRTAVSMADSGEYKCVASNAAGSAEQVIKVYVRGPPNITSFRSSVTGVQGDTISLPCRAKGFPPPVITWSRSGQTIPYDRRQSIDNGTLLIGNIQKSDSGKYTCTAVNTAGERDSVTMTVSIVVSPRITPFMWAPVDEGQREHYTCVVAEGDMPCNITWLRDGKPLYSIPGDLEIMTSQFISSLSIPQVMQRHQGVYTCIVGNRAGIARHSAQLIVYVPSKFVTEPRDQQVLREYTAQLSCQTTGYPPARVEWSKLQGSSFVPLGDNPRFQQLLNGTLVIRNASKRDEGRYSCHAYNGVVGTPVSRQVSLVVHVPAVIVSPPSDRSVEVFGEMAFSCVAIGNLPIMLSWFNGSKQMVDSSRVQIMRYTKDNAHLVNGTLHVSDLRLWDTKEYSCRVGNQFGRDEKTFKITVQESPSNPSVPRVSDISSKSLVLSWTPGFDGNALVHQFIIQFKLARNDWLMSSKQEVLGSSTFYRLTGLKPATTYHVRVYARNAIGTSQPGGSIRVLTKEDAPSLPPKVLNITAVSSTEVLVTWEPPPPEHCNGVIRGYYVSYNEPNRAKVFYNVTVNGGEKMSYLIQKLKKFTEYSVVLQAFTRAGPSTRTRKRRVKTLEDVPSQPPQFVDITVLGSQSILVTWKRPPYDSIHGVLRGYHIRYYRVSDPQSAGETTVDRSRLNVTLRKLGKFTSYRVSVSAFTSVGDGVPSAEMKIKTAEDIPGAPSNVRAIPVSSRKIRVRWDTPMEPNGIIREYRVLYSKVVSRPLANDTSEFVHMLRTNNSNVTSLYLTDMESDTLYYFWVRAITAVGIGNASEVVSKRTMERIKASIFDRTLPDTLSKWKTFAILNCEAYGSPQPTIFWYSRGKDLTNRNKYTHFNNGSLKIMNLEKEDTGKYMCTASNTLGKQTVMRRLRVQIPPSPPQDIAFTGVGRPSAVNISWVPGFDGYSPITMFLLEHKAKGEAWKGVYISHTLRYYILHDIDHTKPYYFRMSAINAVGTGQPARILKVQFAAEGTISSVRQVDTDEEIADDGGGGKRFYDEPAIMGTLITVSLLIVIVVLLLVACRLKRITIKMPKDLRDLWEKAILANPGQRSEEGRCTPIDGGTGDEGNGEGGDSASRSPSSDGHLADSSSSIEQMASTRGSLFSLPRSNGMLHHNIAHEPIMEEPFPPPPPPYQTGSPIRAFPPPPAAHDDNISDTSSEVSFGGQVYHRAMLHDYDCVRVRRYPASASFDSYAQPLPFQPAGVRSVTATPGNNTLGMRGPADGGSELDTTSLAARGLESNSDIRKLFGSHYSKTRGLTLETPHSVHARTPASGISRVPESAFGSRYEIGRRSAASRRGSNASQKLGHMKQPVIIHPEAFITAYEIRRDSASSKESNTYPVDNKALLVRDPRDPRDARAYDSTSSEYSSSRDELMSALEYGKRHNFEKFYGIPTLETTSISSEATNSSEQDGICKFCTSPRPVCAEMCHAPIPIRQPPYNPRSRSRGRDDAFIYVLDPRRRLVDGVVRVQTQAEHKGSLV